MERLTDEGVLSTRKGVMVTTEPVRTTVKKHGHCNDSLWLRLKRRAEIKHEQRIFVAKENGLTLGETSYRESLQDGHLFGEFITETEGDGVEH